MALVGESAAPPGWSSWSEIPAACLQRKTLQKTIAVSLIVGTALFAINWLDVVVSGRATLVVWLKVALNYVVPFCVSNYGFLVATRRAG